MEWEPEIARLRVSRVFSIFDCGRIINKKAGANQILGAAVMGVGMSLFEETHYDHHFGQPINGNFADYLVATCADLPELDVTFLDYPDLIVNEYGARGIGEIGMAGVAPAITSAVYPRDGRARARVAGALLKTCCSRRSWPSSVRGVVRCEE